ncbi:MAG: threonine--tRNA ligase, partial [Bdellovibrionales bacterium]|nr:threonine--tRNA ligase [Bdellovibrionales bacterium]
DLRTPLASGTRLEIITYKHKMAPEVYRHSAAHIMAQAVQSLWPDVQVTIGPVIENGFYYDFFAERKFVPEDLEKIEKKMEDIVSKDLPIVKEVVKSKDAIEQFKKMGEHFKAEIIADLNTDEVSIYHQGDWFDLCRGPHLQTTGQLKAFKVLSVAGAYWRGDETKAQLQRIYATAWPDKKELALYLERLEEAKKRDHRKLGKELGLFHFHNYSPGSPFFTPKGTTIYKELVGFIQYLYRKHGYHEVITPEIFDIEMYKTSGHYENFAENMYFTEQEERELAVKPMNCPGHCLLFGMDKHSYRELPLRIADFGRLHRFERSGALHGITRVRSMCQDDAHIFCTNAQLSSEVKKFVDFLNEVYAALGLDDIVVRVATRPEKRVGSDEDWDRSEKTLMDSLSTLGINFEVSPGDGAFYGPKIEFHVRDAIGRSWQLGTLQLDFNMPHRFGLTYTGDDNSEHTPLMLHRAILGTLERFIGVYLEHRSGHLPTWMAPVQVQILNITDRQNEYCESIKSELEMSGIRVHFDDRNEKLGYKIREGRNMRIPYLAIVGEKEAEEGKVSVQMRGGLKKDGISKEEFIQTVIQEVKNRTLDPVWLGN